MLTIEVHDAAVIEVLNRAAAQFDNYIVAETEEFIARAFGEQR